MVKTISTLGRGGEPLRLPSAWETESQVSQAEGPCYDTWLYLEDSTARHFCTLLNLTSTRLI